MHNESITMPLTVTVPLTQGYEAIIDLSDYMLICQYRWHALVMKSHVYACAYVRGSSRRVNGKKVSEQRVYMHRLILRPADGKVADHVNGRTLDNRRANLREVDSSGNARNNSTARMKALLDAHGISY